MPTKIKKVNVLIKHPQVGFSTLDNSTTVVSIPTPKGWKCKRKGCTTDWKHTHGTYSSLKKPKHVNDPIKPFPAPVLPMTFFRDTNYKLEYEMTRRKLRRYQGALAIGIIGYAIIIFISLHI